MKTMNKINTASERAINESIATGQVIRNGGGRAFKLEVAENEVTLHPLNDTIGKTCVLGRKVFVQLYWRKNYVQIPEGMNPLTDANTSRTMGSERFIIK